MAKKSIMGTQKGFCYMCFRYTPTEKHHIFGGTANRRLSEEDGLWVYLCQECHNIPPRGVHFNPYRREWLQKAGQRAYENNLIAKGMPPAEARAAFMQRYGKNYL